MFKRRVEVGKNGFHGLYWPYQEKTKCAIIAMIGDDAEDYLARTSVRWLHKQGCNVMTMSLAKKRLWAS